MGWKPLALPHMATSTTKSLQYTPVQISAFDANQNSVPVLDQVLLTDRWKPGCFTRDRRSKREDESRQPVQRGLGSSTCPSCSMTISTASKASSSPCLAPTDATNAQVVPANFRIHFVGNRQVAALQRVAPPSAAAGGTEAVVIHLNDPSGHQVGNATDTIALAIKPGIKGQVVVTDAAGNVLTANAQGQYLLDASAGVSVFRVQDNAVEALGYTLTDVTEPQVKAATATGNS